MQQEKRSLSESLDKMSIEDEIFKSDSCCSKNKEKRQMGPQSIDSGSIIQGKKSLGLFNKLLGSDSNKPYEMCEETQDTRQQVQEKEGQLRMLRSDQSDKYKMKQIIWKESFRMENQGLTENPINHECECIKFRQTMYCPANCQCYDKLQMCSKLNCCPQCYKTKLLRLPKLLHASKEQWKISPTKMEQDFIEIWGSGKPNKRTPIIVPIQPKKHHCKCRKTQCHKNYCICRKNNEECDPQCGCQLPCINREVALYPAPMKQPIKPYLSDNESLESSNKSMRFDKFNYT